ncbi:signal peptide-containing lipoprotein [Bacillus phage vB_BanS_Nate]|uniref:Signal peptide-containing lipoprotein n=1 Tax=Bacillus phage vB_BanS_Nate TaxID=2894788 RepID=A0AAE8YUZ5_9CAUD|nr:signal peptide-containing lipoprotein [Bacillus phage vB_BanS_Nate]UGO51021.1 signal peptide-containing lipoprotein [Bacillus phage vB_BanS_Nate]
MSMKKFLVGLALVVGLTGLTGCQMATRKMGGSYDVNLPKGEKLVNVTWKESSLWYMTRPMTPEDKVETYKFKEDSTFGVMEGTVTIKESR